MQLSPMAHSVPQATPWTAGRRIEAPRRGDSNSPQLANHSMYPMVYDGYWGVAWMTGDNTGAVSRILRNPGTDSVDRLLPLIYDDLRRMARHSLRGEAAGHTLNPTALAHEAYLKLAGVADVARHGRSYFFGAVARAMRRILVDHARSRRRQKRGGDRQRVTLNTARQSMSVADELIELDDALEKLAAVAPRQASVVEYRYFGGMSVAEVAELLGVSERTVKSDWAFARSWLYRCLNVESATPTGPAKP